MQRNPAPVQEAVVKFYRADRPHPLDGGENYFGISNGLLVFPDYRSDLLKGLRETPLAEKSLKVTLRDHPLGGDKLIACCDDNIAIQPDCDIFNQAPIVLIDGQNFLRDMRNLNPYASAYATLISVLKKFRRPPKAIEFHICLDSANDIDWQLQDIEKNSLSDPQYRISIRYRKSKRINTGNGSFAKTDIDPILLPDMGEIIGFYREPGETLLLFSGDSDCCHASQKWLGIKESINGDKCRGRMLAVASSRHNKTFSREMQEVCNDPNGKLLLLENFVSRQSVHYTNNMAS